MWTQGYKILLAGTKGVGKQTLTNAMLTKAKVPQLQFSQNNVSIPYISPYGHLIILDIFKEDYVEDVDFILHVQRNGIPKTRTPRYDRIIHLPNDKNNLPEFADKLMFNLFNHLYFGEPFRV